MYKGPNRKSNRWQGHDYSSPGYYFVTICTKNRETLFGEIIDYKMELNNFGEIVKKQWLWLQDNFLHIKLDEWIIMPNHVHGIIEINFDEDSGKPVGDVLERPLQGNTNILPLYRIIGAFKTTSSKLIHRAGYNNFAWQKSFHDRIIRSEKELLNIREYISNNPVRWTEDRNNSIILKH